MKARQSRMYTFTALLFSIVFFCTSCTSQEEPITTFETPEQPNNPNSPKSESSAETPERSILIYQDIVQLANSLQKDEEVRFYQKPLSFQEQIGNFLGSNSSEKRHGNYINALYWSVFSYLYILQDYIEQDNTLNETVKQDVKDLKKRVKEIMKSTDSSEKKKEQLEHCLYITIIKKHHVIDDISPNQLTTKISEELKKIDKELGKNESDIRNEYLNQFDQVIKIHKPLENDISNLEDTTKLKTLQKQWEKLHREISFLDGNIAMGYKDKAINMVLLQRKVLLLRVALLAAGNR